MSPAAVSVQMNREINNEKKKKKKRERQVPHVPLNVEPRTAKNAT